MKPEPDPPEIFHQEVTVVQWSAHQRIAVAFWQLDDALNDQKITEFCFMGLSWTVQNKNKNERSTCDPLVCSETPVPFWTL